jgi:WD40 repeat protein
VILEDTAQIWLASSGTIQVFTEEQELMHILNLSKKNPVTCMAQHQNLVWVGSTGWISLYDVETLEFMGCFEAHSAPVTSIVSIGTDYVWSTASADICVWNVKVL